MVRQQGCVNMVRSSSSRSSLCHSLFKAAPLAQEKCLASSTAVEELDGRDRRKVPLDFRVF